MIKIKICLDSGHGGFDKGANYRGIMEKDLNLIITNHVKNMLEESDYKVFCTHDLLQNSNNKLSLKTRCDYSNKNNCDIFVSIHHNASIHKTVNGSIVFYHRFSENGEKLAKAIAEEFSKEKIIPKSLNYSWEDFYVLKHTKAPAVLIECGFMSNYKELEILKDNLVQIFISDCVKRGIDEYFN